MFKLGRVRRSTHRTQGSTLFKFDAPHTAHMARHRGKVKLLQTNTTCMCGAHCHEILFHDPRGLHRRDLPVQHNCARHDGESQIQVIIQIPSLLSYIHLQVVSTHCPCRASFRVVQKTCSPQMAPTPTLYDIHLLVASRYGDKSRLLLLQHR